MLNVEGLMLNAGDSVRIVAFSPVKIQTVSNSTHDVLVNLLQNNYYGWKTSVDGQPVEILTGNMSFISVPWCLPVTMKWCLLMIPWG